MTIACRLATLCLFAGTSLALAQSATQEDLGAVTASSLTKGLSWSVTAENEAEFAAAAAAGATHVRIDACEWPSVEQQTAPPNNASVGYTLPAGCESGLVYAKKYGLQPIIVGAYGAPFHRILTLSVTSASPAGATVLPVEYSDGVGGKTISSLAMPYDYVANSNNSLSNKNSYAGTLIASVSLSGPSSATLTLASALSAAVPAGTVLTVNEVLYPSPITASPSDPSVIAYAHYVEYVAKQIQAYGLNGEVELWNEPVWANDCWDNRRNCYDTDPGIAGEMAAYGPNYGFVAALQRLPAVSGVSYVWAGTNKTGTADLLYTNMVANTGTNYIPTREGVTSESFHPYGSNPEDAMWNEPCVRASSSLNQAQLCNTTGSGANYVVTEARNLLEKNANADGGINHSITETGASSLYMPADHMARFVTRQYLGYMADNLSYVNFYRLFDASIAGQSGFSFVTLTENKTSFTPLPAYTALAGLMTDLVPIQSAPVSSYLASSLPSVTSYNGTWNLDHLAVVGSRPGDKTNSIAYMLWQRSYSPTMCKGGVANGCWAQVPQPVGAPTTVSIPAGLKILQVVNLDTREAIDYQLKGSLVTFEVSDDPIELMLIPSGDPTNVSITPDLVFESIPGQAQGSSVAVHANSVSSGAITYSIVSGPAIVSGSMVTATGPGTVTVKAVQAAKGNYTATTATASFSVSAKTPKISLDYIPTRTYGATVKLTASSPSSAGITFSIASGPATVSGNMLTTNGIGTVVVQASQTASGVYTAATATTSFAVTPQKPLLNFGYISAKTYGDVFPVSATSASKGSVTYTVTSGPATISGSTLTTTGVGEVWLLASQVANGGYSAGTATYSFYVGAATPTLVFAPVPDQPYSTSFTVKASSASPNAITYSVLSGPASYVGSTITTKKTSGTVVVQAIQAGGGAWARVTTTTSFHVAETSIPAISVASISSTTVGAVVTVSATSPSSGSFTYFIVSGPATISQSVVTTTGVGTVVVGVSQVASGKYSAGSATASFAVAAAITATKLSLAPISAKVHGNIFNVTAQSNSNEPITYSIISGPATISGSTVTVTGGVGTVIVMASQPASLKFAAMSVTSSFTVKLIAPDLALAAIPAKRSGSVFTANATSKSSAPITYSIVSGSATVSKGSVTLTGKGAVVLRADQASDGIYGPANTTITIQVN